MSDIKPSVSVIIPNYNHSRFLRQRIDSVLQQTYRDFEVIILDDCSTDDSRDIIELYRDKEQVTHIVYNCENSGSPFLQWHKGFSLARGKYIWIAESDDFSSTAFLEDMVPLLDKNKDCVVAFCGSHSVDEEGNILDENWDMYSDKPGELTLFAGWEFIQNRMMFNNSIYNAGMAIFRKDVLPNVSDRYLEYRYCGDWFFWYQVCLQGEVVRYNQKFNYFRQHDAKATPRAKSEGLIFTEGKYVIDDMIKKLSLSHYQATVVIGRFLKRIVRSRDFGSEDIKKEVLDDCMRYLNRGKSSIYVYILDKVFNFSSLDIKKNRYI